ncbi:hypothetical protein GCK72_010950 [Caenorhabditis remanei]|uniref:Domain of unknown function DB domain-containing protein n=1 Tax=Caenorhabditis remanei TaxID=31234 RepID=A0A6A5H4P8_CAERE|nr:hypothetical protein GCK72_010950 [Caenorhabditis remanei]KAF1762688.1 hypothetical protein GCK72_010950 [Caenorhabditis remanei]
MASYTIGILVAFVAVSDACLSSGVCGSSYCAAPPAVSCSPSSCQPGYSCGQYGCARNRARSALTQKVDGIFIDSTTSREVPASRENSREVPKLKGQKNNIFGLRRESSRGSSAETPPVQQPAHNYENSTLLQYTNPNFIFRQCCEQRGLPDACLNKCHFNSYTKDACCVRNGVTTTLAGQKCLTFCDQRPDRVTKLDYSYVPCYDRFENMKQCFYNEIKQKAEQQFGAARRR